MIVNPIDNTYREELVLKSPDLSVFYIIALLRGILVDGDIRSMSDKEKENESNDFLNEIMQKIKELEDDPVRLNQFLKTVLVNAKQYGDSYDVLKAIETWKNMRDILGADAGILERLKEKEKEYQKAVEDAKKNVEYWRDMMKRDPNIFYQIALWIAEGQYSSAVGNLEGVEKQINDVNGQMMNGVYLPAHSLEDKCSELAADGKNNFNEILSNLNNTLKAATPDDDNN